MSKADEIRQLVSLSQVVGTNDKKIRCPLHEDKHPSLNLDHHKNLWHCPVCDIGGSIYDWLMKTRRMDFIDALKECAGIAGVPLENDPKAAERYDALTRVYEARKYAVNYYHNLLLNQDGMIAYWAGRGFTMDTIKRFKLGWSNAKLKETIASSMPPGLTMDDFIAAGLIKSRPGHVPTDYFDRRFIIPMINNGRVVNITGRQSDVSTHHDKKYMHLTGDGLLTDLFNEDVLMESRTIWLFEGQADAMMAAQLELPAVGVVGTNGLKEPRKLARADEIYIVPDNDAAGQRASADWAGAILKENPMVKIKIVALPEAKDFNEWALKRIGYMPGLQAAFKTLKEEAKGIIEHRIGQLKTTDDLLAVWPFIASIPKIQQDGYYKLIKKQLPNLTVQALRKDFTDWERSLRASVSSNGLSVSKVIFEETFRQNVNIDFEIGHKKHTGHICVYGNVTRIDDEGKEISSYEPVMIRSTIDEETQQNAREMVIVNDNATLASSPTVPFKDVVRGRWSDQGIQDFLAGRTAAPKTSDIIDLVADFFRQYVWFEDAATYELLAFWTLGTYIARSLGSYPYLSLNGIKNTGKSNTLELLTSLCFNAMESVQSSLSATFRLIASSFVTYIRDEAETFNKVTPENAEELTILNSGYKSGASVNRTEKNKNGEMEVQAFKVFSPKVFAGINALNPTLMSRSILMDTRRATDSVTVKLKNMKQTEGEWNRKASAYRDMMHVWALTRFHDVKTVFNSHPPVNEITNRDWELWLPIFTLAYMADADAGNVNENSYSKRVEEVALEKTRHRKKMDSEDSVELRLLSSLIEILETSQITAFIPSEHPHWYITTVVCEKITERFKEEDFYKENWKMTPKRMFTILKQTGVFKKDMEYLKNIRQFLDRKRCMYLNLEDIKTVYKGFTG